jgi:electron transport complex protein RnfB
VLPAEPVLAAVAVLSGVAGVAGLALGWAAQRLTPDRNTLVDRIDALLPQTQCAQCGYPGCRPYARAVAEGEAIDRCPPGGGELVRALSDLLPPSAITAAFAPPATPAVAYIDEAACVGCALCLPACPVDAIVGAPHFLHTVLAAECTGCALCLPPCPVDCIRLVGVDATPRLLEPWS